MEMKKNRRIWLNPINSLDFGAAMTRVETFEDAFGSLDATVTLWDCNRKVDLAFNASTKREFNERIKKLDRLILLLEEFREDMYVAWEDMNDEQ
jgi:WD40 repeat protein